MKRKKIVVIGGGTGTFTALTGLKKYPVDLSVIVTMTDSGGSNRVIRDEFGLLPTSDIRQCMVALSDDESDQTLRKLFTYRYNHGTGITGMTFGNLFMAALTDIFGSQERAIEETCEMLHVSGQIIPVTYENTNLVATYKNGKQVLGEHFIDEPNASYADSRITKLEVFPKARANKKALSAIAKADLILLGPGDLFTSIICNIVIGKIAVAIAKSKAKCVYVVNLMTRLGQTNNFTARQHLNELNKYLGKKVIDYCVINKQGAIPKSHLKWYKEKDATIPVLDDLDSYNGLKIIRGDYVSNKGHHKASFDKLTRSLIRHDPDKLAKAIMSLL